MNEVTGVALFSTLQWPRHALGERALLVIESYDASRWVFDRDRDERFAESMSTRGFEALKPGAWSFPYLDTHQIALDEAEGDFALIDDAADELFAYPISSIPTAWYSHLRLERNCLIITGQELGIARYGIAGVEQAAAAGRAFGAMVLINDGRVHDDLDVGARQ